MNLLCFLAVYVCVWSVALRQVQSNVKNALIRIRFKLISISQWPRKPAREAHLISSWVELIFL